MTPKLWKHQKPKKLGPLRQKSKPKAYPNAMKGPVQQKNQRPTQKKQIYLLKCWSIFEIMYFGLILEPRVSPFLSLYIKAH